MEVTSTWVTGPKVSQLNVAESVTLMHHLDLLSIVEPGAISSPGKLSIYLSIVMTTLPSSTAPWSIPDDHMPSLNSICSIT